MMMATDKTRTPSIGTPNDTDMELMGNLNPEDSDDISALIFEQLGMGDQRRRNASKRHKTEGMPDERAV